MPILGPDGQPTTAAPLTLDQLPAVPDEIVLTVIRTVEAALASGTHPSQQSVVEIALLGSLARDLRDARKRRERKCVSTFRSENSAEDAITDERDPAETKNPPR